MTLKRTFALAALMAGTTLLHAQSTRFDAGGSVVLPLDTLTAVTHHGGVAGLVVEGGYNSTLGSTGIPVRVSVSVNDLPGNQDGDVKSSLMGYQVAGDLRVPTGWGGLTGVVGVSLNGWRWDYQDATRHDVMSMKGAKFGARFGFDCPVAPRWTAALMLQLVELGTDNQATRPYNPSWIQAGLRYRF